MNVGDRVRIERDEVRYPSQGTWPQFRGKTGTIVEINLGEYGVCFGKVTPASAKSKRKLWYDTKAVAWFQPYEVQPVEQGRTRKPPQPGPGVAAASPGVAVPEAVPA
jgi:hypothetical protein